MLLRQCPLNAPAHTPAAPPRPHPAHPLSVPRKSVTFLRHPSPAMPHPPPRAPTSSPRLRNFSPRIRPNPAFSPTLLKHTHIRATLAHARDRPRGPETLPPSRVRAPGIRRGAENWPPATARPLSYSVTRRHFCVPSAPCLHDSLAQDSRHSQLRNAQNVAETNRFRLPAYPVPVETGSGNTGVGGTK